MSTAVRALLLATAMISSACASPTPEERFNAAVKVLRAQCGDYCSPGEGSDPAERKAIDALWDATQDWTLAFLESHPGITTEKLKTELLNRHPRNMEAESVAPGWVAVLAHDLYAFSTDWNWAGNVFLVGKRGGRWTVVWDIRSAETGRFAVLKAWRSDHGGDSCRDDDLGVCGSLFGGVFPLKPDAQGRVRFGLGGTYAQGGGFTFAKQISFWRWDDTKAEPLLAHTYQQYLEDQQASEPNTPSRVVVRVKDEYKTVSACGSCVGRQLDWTFRIQPDRIVDEGKRPLDPEADFIDALYVRLKDHRPVTGLGTPQALALMAHTAPEGMGDFEVQRDRSGAKVCLSAEGAERLADPNIYATIFLRFSLERRGAGYFLTRVETLSQDNFVKACYPAAK